MSYPPDHPPPPSPYGHGGYPPQAPQWTPPPQIDPKRVRPSRAWYWLTPLPAIAGLVLTAVFVVQLVARFDPNLARIRAPGSVVVTLDAGDKRGIYTQTYSAIGALPAVADPACTVRDARSERSVQVEGAPSGNTLTIGTAEYVERLRFEVPSDGRYAVTCSQPPGARLAVGPQLSFRAFVIPIVGTILSFLIGLALSAAIAIVIAVKRSSHKKRLQREALQR